MTQAVLVQKKDGRRRPLTEEHRRKISEGNKDKIISEETRVKISAGWTLERKMKHSEAMSGKNNPNFGGLSEEHKTKMSAYMTGKTRSKESCAKQSATITGRIFTKEHRDRQSASLMGHIVSDKTRAKISAARTGKYTGENSANWRGGISFEPYCPQFNNPLREQYRNAYGRVCAYCDKPEILNGHRLSVHHVDGNKNQGCDEHDWFLVPLCKSCNSKGFERKPEYIFLFWLKDIERKHRRSKQQ